MSAMRNGVWGPALAVPLAAVLALSAGCAVSPGHHGKTGAMGQTSPVAGAAVDVTDAVALSAIREKALSTVRELAASETPQFRANAVEAASQSPQRLAGIIEAGLGDKNPGVRSVAAMAVGQAKLMAAAARVEPLLRDGNAYVRSAAIYALVRCGLPVDRSPLAKMLMEDPSPRVRSQVAFILGELGDKSAVWLLKSALTQRMPTSPAEQVRLFELQTAEAIIKLGGEEMRPAVRAALFPSRQDDLETTALACQILGTIHDRESANQMMRLSEYTDDSGNHYPPEVQLAVAGGLAALGHREGTFIADQFVGHRSALVRTQVAYVYGQIGKTENWGKLDALMGDSYGGVRIAAAAAVLKSSEAAHFGQ